MSISDVAVGAGMTFSPLLQDADTPEPHTGFAPDVGPAILIVPGLNGSCDSHWQSRWELERGDCIRADLGLWKNPPPAVWAARLDRAVRAVAGPVVLVAHSLGCIATAQWARDYAVGANIIGALLVAPCDPEAPDACARLNRFSPFPQARLPFPSVVVASSNDPYATLDRSRHMAAAWGSAFIDAGAKGHINARSNLGAWAEGQGILARFLDTLAPA